LSQVIAWATPNSCAKLGGHRPLGASGRMGEMQPKVEMWANAQRDGRPAEYRWRRLFNAAKFG